MQPGQQLALLGSSGSLHSHACNVLGVSEELPCAVSGTAEHVSSALFDVKCVGAPSAGHAPSALFDIYDP
eukprot:12083729-Karenia_brevis.AAC.1